MAKFINTREAGSEIEKLIKKAEHKLVLISPYLKLSQDFKELLTFRNGMEKVTTVIFGKQELKPDEMAFLQGLRFVVLKYKENLHAKCYANDQFMIITSLNLYEYSMVHNREMGVLIDKNDPADTQLFADAWEEVEFISKTSQGFEFSATEPGTAGALNRSKEPSKEAAPKPIANRSSDKAKGFCIRTGVEIPFNIEKPLSYDAYKSWSKYSDANYAEKFCHFSGEPSSGETSVSKPILKKNWSKAKAAFDL